MSITFQLTAALMFSFTTHSNNRSDPGALFFLYDYHQGKDGADWCETPFYLHGIGVINNAVKLKEELPKLKKTLADDQGGLSCIEWKLLAKDLDVPIEDLPKSLGDSKFKMTDVKITVALTKSKKGEHFILFIERGNIGKISGVISRLTNDERKKIELILSKQKPAR